MNALPWDLGARIQKMRKYKGLSQKQLATRLHVTPTTISHYENETQTPSLETIRKMAIELCCSADFLMGLDDNPTIKIYNLSDRERELWYSLIDLYAGKDSKE